jgi:hypothetical protein
MKSKKVKSFKFGKWDIKIEDRDGVPTLSISAKGEPQVYVFTPDSNEINWNLPEPNHLIRGPDQYYYRPIRLGDDEDED